MKYKYNYVTFNAMKPITLIKTRHLSILDQQTRIDTYAANAPVPQRRHLGMPSLRNK